ncbi:unnamed protein product, partial [Brassica oleracea]
ATTKLTELPHPRVRTKTCTSKRTKKNTKNGPAMWVVEAHSTGQKTLFTVVIKLERRQSVFS